MSHLAGEERAEYVRSMFARIARRYDLLNRLMTLGQDVRWRAEAVCRLEAKPGDTILDLGAGTGDISFEILRRHPDARVIACDFTPEMISVGRQRPLGGAVVWMFADVQKLPFAAGTVQGVISGFLLRNVTDVPAVLEQQFRVLTSGGRVVSLDTTPPHQSPFRLILEFHLHRVIPALGRLVAGDAEAYRYLPDSTEQFLSAENLAGFMYKAGFTAVGFARRMFNTIAIHWGEKSR